jgi:cell division protein FtsI/penicillin-binding protein 2
LAGGKRTLALGALLAGVLAGCSGSTGSPQAAAAAFVSAWNKADWAALTATVYQPPPDLASSLPDITSGLAATKTTHTLTGVSRLGPNEIATIVSVYQLPGIGPWPVRSSVVLEHRGKWLVEWSPAAVYPGLTSGQRLVLDYKWPARAPILGAGGASLTVDQPQVIVGLEGSRIKQAAQVTAVLEAAGATALQVEAAEAGAKAHPTFFEPVFTIPESRYAQLGGKQSALYQAPGTVFQHVSGRTAATPGLAAHLVGTVGAVTAQELAALGPPYDQTSSVGQTGLEAAYERQLAGTPGGSIDVVVGVGGPVRTVAQFAAKPGTPVTTSIDPAVQTAAEAALAGVGHDAALVAVRASTGQVLASVSDPASEPFDQALAGEFPPGSSFKIVTATALIEAGLSTSSAASCPPTATVDGEVFHNAEGESPVSDLSAAFTESCNTAFVQLAASRLSGASLRAAAAQYGLGTSPKMGLGAFGGSVPDPKDQAALAASAIGQASVVVAPLDMAMVAAAVDSGAARPARLVAGAPDDSAPARPLPGAVLSALRQMMSAVVSSGTAAGTGLPDGTFAKTGTAQYGSGNPLPTDAWLVGYRGDVAFAVVVHGSTKNGGPEDGPIIARFLGSLPAGYA